MYRIFPTLLNSFQYYLHSDSEEAFQQLIDTINRKDFTSEAMEKGTAFEKSVNTFIFSETEEIIMDRFNFKTSIVKEFSEKFDDSLSQVFCEAILPTTHGEVLLYGYIDKLKGDTAFDIKTTSNYLFPKYIDQFQHLCYIYCLRKMGNDVNRFKYAITDFNSTFEEEYIWNEEKDTLKLKNICEHFIHFLEQNKHLITDLKIFGDENNN